MTEKSHTCDLCEKSVRKCPDCGAELLKGKTVKEPDGTEYSELICPKCKKRYADIKIPHDVFFEDIESVAG